MMQVEQIVVLAAGALSLLFAYVPGFKNWYEKLGSEQKQLVMLGLLVVMVAGAFGLGCAGVFDGYACSGAGAFEALWTLVLAIAANAGVYKATNYIRK